MYRTMHKDSTEDVRCNSSVNPTKSQVSYLFQDFEKAAFGERNGEGLYKHLEKVCEDYKHDHYDKGGRLVFVRATTHL